MIKNKVISEIQEEMKPYLNESQNIQLNKILLKVLKNAQITQETTTEYNPERNLKLLNLFLEYKQCEGLSNNSLNYYRTTIYKMLNHFNKNVECIDSSDMVQYLSNYNNSKKVSNTTLDNIRRILNHYFNWLVKEDYINKNPVISINNLLSEKHSKEIQGVRLDKLKGYCNLRDMIILDLLYSTGLKTGELCKLNITDVELYNHTIRIKGKFGRERFVKINGSCKENLQKYLEERTDDNSALFVSLKKPYTRLGVNGVEVMMSGLRKKCGVNLNPRAFRESKIKSMIKSGIPLEQVQKELGHVRVATTERYLEDII